jgi:hypothetical protein
MKYRQFRVTVHDVPVVHRDPPIGKIATQRGVQRDEFALLPLDCRAVVVSDESTYCFVHEIVDASFVVPSD